ncbi:hypothetical protein TNCV_1149171 [Trichonephila clavipes]|nr:hypothetical protein TNCV_1149171 [Trichonephila clavipes]
MKVTWCEIRTGGWCRRFQPRVAIWFCIAVAECGLALSFNNRTSDLRSPGHFLRITLDQGVTIPRGHCDTLVPNFKKSTQNLKKEDKIVTVENRCDDPKFRAAFTMGISNSFKRRICVPGEPDSNALEESTAFIRF